MAASEETKLLLSLEGTQALTAPILGSKKIKYTCIACSRSFIALGANTGGVYCFLRDGLRYIRILANKEGSVSMVKFSPNEGALAVVSGAGHLCLWELNLQEHGVSKRLHVCSLLKEGSIRDLVWDYGRVIFADDTGRVAMAYLPKNQKLFKKSDEVLLQEKVPIVQLGLHGELLLVSTVSRCVLLKLASREVVQIGTRPREGQFGACFHDRGNDKPPVVFSARPGGRLWQADIEGTVVSTLKLKDAVCIPARPVWGSDFSPDFEQSSKHHLTHSLHFHRLCLLHNTLLVAWVGGDLFLFQPSAYKLSYWTGDVGPLTDLCSDGRQLFLLTEAGDVRILSYFSLTTVLQCLVRLQLMDQALQVLESHCEELVQLLESSSSLYNNVKSVLASIDTIPDSLAQLKSTIEQLNDKYQTQPPLVDDQYQSIDLMGYSEPTDHVSNSSEHVTSIEDHVSLDHMTEPEDHVVSSEDHVSLGADFPMRVDDNSEPTLDETLIASDSSTSLTGQPSDNPPSSISPDPVTAQPEASPKRNLSSNFLEVSSKPEDPPSEIAIQSGKLHEETGHEMHIKQSFEGTPELGTSMGSNLDNTDFTDRLAAALSSYTETDDVVVVKERERKSKKKGSRKKKPASPVHIPSRRLSTPDLTGGSKQSVSPSLVHIPEEALPFPEVGLPQPIQRAQSVGSIGAHSIEPSPNESTLLSLVKKQAEKPVQMVKGLLSSLAISPQNSTGEMLFTNEGFNSDPKPDEVDVTKEVPAVEAPVVGEDSVVPVVEAEDVTDGIVDELDPLTEATNNTLELLSDPTVYCSPSEIITALESWSNILSTSSAIDSRACQLLELCLQLEVYSSLAQFVSSYSEHLDSSAIRETLRQQDWPARLETWRALIKQQEPKGGGCDLDVANTQYYLLPATLHRLLTNSPDSSPLTCATAYPSLLPWEVALASQSVDSSQSHDMIFPSYLQALDSQCDLIELVGADHDLLFRALEASLLVNHGEMLERLCQCCASVLRGDQLGSARNLCKQYTYWPGVVWLSTAMGDKTTAIDTALLYDISLLFNQKWGDVLVTYEDWRMVCTKWKPGLLKHMVHSLPAHMIIELLSFSRVEGEVIHGALTQLAQLQAKQRSIGHALLERVDQYLWSPRPLCFAPQIAALPQNKEGVLTSVPAVDSCLEDSGTHWGARVEGTCPCCRLSLLDTVADLQPGVIALGCGHAYHKMCLPETACVLCFVQNYLHCK